MAAIQRSDSALRLNVHFHVLALDGVYLRAPEKEKLVFHSLPTPTRAEVADIATRTRARLERIFDKHGRFLDSHPHSVAEPHPLEQEEPGLSACYAAAAQGVAVSGERVGQPALRIVIAQPSPPQATSNTSPPGEPTAEVGGISIFAKQRVDGRNRRQLERLCRYITHLPWPKTAWKSAPMPASRHVVQGISGRLPAHPSPNPNI
ncbi:MAG: transposase [Polyangiaceae bacterium]|nr:transposase [Polyangiaceae bacterium]